MRVVFAAWTEVMISTSISTMIVIVKVIYKMIPHVILQFILMRTIERLMSITGRAFHKHRRQWK